MAKSLAYYFAVAIIASFVLSLFVVVLYSPTQQENVATPTPQAAFEGTGVANGSVVSFSDRLLVSCSAGSVDATSFDGIAGVKRVIKASNEVAIVEVNSSLFNESSGVFDVVYNNSACVPRVLRLAVIDLNESQFVITAKDLRNQSLFKRQVEVFFSSRGGVQAYVNARSVVNQSVQLIVSGRLEGGALTGFFAEDRQPPLQNIVFANVNATVENLTGKYVAVKQVAWAERNSDWRGVVAQLNFSGSLNLTGASYDALSEVVVNAVEGELENVSAKLGNESIVKGVEKSGGGLKVSVQSNATQSDVAAALGNARASNYSFTNSTLRIEFATQDGQAAKSAVSILVGDFKLTRVAGVRLLERRKVALEAGAVLPEKFNADVKDFRKEGDVVRLQVFALAQDGVAASASANEVS